MLSYVARYPKVRGAHETDDEIIVHGHCGVCDLEEERFSREDHYLYVPTWGDLEDKFILILSKDDPTRENQ